MNVDPSVIAMLVTPSVVVGVVGWLLKRAINGTDTAVNELRTEVKSLRSEMTLRELNAARAEVREARLEARIEAMERELYNPKKGA